MKRRDFLMSSGAVTLGFGAAGGLLAQGPRPHRLVIQQAAYPFRDQVTQGLVSLSPDAPPPVLRGKVGQPMRLEVTNQTPDYTAMHWHGLRIPNAMDGVPYLTQMPIAPGETFTYDFTPPDAGTFWYHPHCMTMAQMAHGLTGVVVIEEEADLGFDSEQVLNLRDFRLAEDGSFLPYYTARGAARGGTHGNVLTTNWQQAPSYDHGAGSLVRLRIAIPTPRESIACIWERQRHASLPGTGIRLRALCRAPAQKRPCSWAPGSVWISRSGCQLATGNRFR